MKRSLSLLLGLTLILLALALTWRWLAMEGILTARYLREQLSALADWRGHPLLIPAIMAAYSLLLLFMFPLTLLVVLTGLLFGPLWGLFYALLGTLGSSVTSYLAGRHVGQAALLRFGGRRLRSASVYLGQRGIRTMILINLLPLAPFTMTNMLAGASHIRFRDYMIGSTLGIIPGLVVVTLLGSQLGALITAADSRDILLALGGVLLCAVLWLVIRSAIRHTSPEDPD